MDYSLAEEFDFGFGPVPAHRHKKGGGWVANTAYVSEDCYVGPYALVYGKASVQDNCRIDGYARVFEEARILENACVYGAAKVYGNARISGRARISGDAKVYGNASVSDEAMVFEFAEVFDNAQVRHYSEVHGNAKVKSNALLVENSKIYDKCVVSKQPIVITGVSSNIICTDHHITVGCVTLPPKIWEIHGKTLIRFFINMPGTMSPRNISEKWIDGIKLITDIHGCVDLPEDIENFNLKECINKVLSDDRFWIQNDR